MNRRTFAWTTLGLVITIAIVYWLAVPSTPACIDRIGWNKVQVQTVYDNVVPLRCDATEINVWLEQNEYRVADRSERNFVK